MKAELMIATELLANVVVTIFGLTTTISSNGNNNNNETWVDESEYILTTMSNTVNNCELYKTQCHNDTDCYHRLFYVHSTCILNGVCKPQCKTAILRLYESEYGRRLLHSDLSCLQAVKSDLVDCELSPEAETVHCTLARQICHANDRCHANLNTYESECESKLLNIHRCPSSCVDRLVDVFRTVEGRKLADCRCWTDEDALCQHRKAHVLDPCNRLALDALLNNGKDKSNELEQIVLNIVDHNENDPTDPSGDQRHRDGPVIEKSTDRHVLKQRINGCQKCGSAFSRMVQLTLFVLFYIGVL